MTDRNVIPPITEPLGRYWDQPDPASILVDSTHAVMSQRAFDELCEYSASIPSGTYEGKMWKRQCADGSWWLSWFCSDPNPKMIGMQHRRILVVA